MKLKITKFFVLWDLINLAGADAFADEATEFPFDCQNKVLVQQSPAAHWNDLGKSLDKHLAFMQAQMKAGNIASAGPIVSEAGEPLGGVAIYNLTDKQKVEDIAKTDPLIANGVATYTIQSWRQCVSK